MAPGGKTIFHTFDAPVHKEHTLALHRGHPTAALRQTACIRDQNKANPCDRRLRARLPAGDPGLEAGELKVTKFRLSGCGASGFDRQREAECRPGSITRRQYQIPTVLLGDLS